MQNMFMNCNNKKYTLMLESVAISSHDVDIEDDISDQGKWSTKCGNSINKTCNGISQVDINNSEQPKLNKNGTNLQEGHLAG